MTIVDIKNTPIEFTKLPRLSIIDQNASISDIEFYLSEYEEIKDLTIHANLERLPNGLEKLSIENLNIESSSELLKIDESNIPTGLARCYIKAKSINEIPHKLWSIQRLNIIAEIKQQPDSNESLGHDNFDCNLCVPNLKSVSNIKCASLNIESNDLTTIDKNFFTLNTESLKRLSIKAPTLRQINHSKQRLETLNFVLLFTKQSIEPNDLDFLPDEIGMIQLEGRQISTADFSRFNKIQHLYIRGDVKETISIKSYNCQSISIYDSYGLQFGKMETPNLRKLTLNNATKEVPEFIFNCDKLSQIQLSHNEISKLPKDWSTLSNLEYLNLSNNYIIFNSLEFLTPLKKLKATDLSGNKFANKYILFTNRKLPISYNGWQFLIPSCKNRFDEVLKLGSALERANIDIDNKKLIFDEFINDEELKILNVNNAPLLIEAFKINYRPIKLKLDNIISKLCADSSGLDIIATAVVYIDGKTKLSKNEIKSKLEKIGAKVLNKYSKEVTHILLGGKPNRLESFGEGLYYINESDIASFDASEKFINVQVDSGNDAILDKIKGFLISPDNANIMLALKMMDTGGVNPALFSPLLAVSKANTDAKVRKEANRLLTLYGPKEWAPLLSNKLLFKNLHTKVREQDINNKLEKLSKEVGENLAYEMSLSLYKRFEKGLRYMIYKSKLPDDYAQRMYDVIYSDGHVSYDKALGFRNWKNVPADQIIFNTTKAKLKLHEGIASQKVVSSIGLHNCKIFKFPRSLTKFTDTKILDLSCNNLSELPTTISKMKNMEEIDLSFNCFNEFPEVLYDMPKLLKVNLQHNRSTSPISSFVKIEIPDEVQSRLPNCTFIT